MPVSIVPAELVPAMSVRRVHSRTILAVLSARRAVMVQFHHILVRLHVHNALLGSMQQMPEMHVLNALRVQRVELDVGKVKERVQNAMNLNMQRQRISFARIASFRKGSWTMEKIVTIKVATNIQIVSKIPMEKGTACEANALISLERQLAVLRATTRRCARCLM